ncbi:MAG TPA: PHB depolymerase family esterase [Chloroflexia bacterium]|nr:PHB depolymerase family esterase [Chloroflexia bacterium]
MMSKINLRYTSIALCLSAAFLLALMIFMPSPARAGEFITRIYGDRIYKILVPDGYQQGTPIPLVVMLHGCTQNPDDFAAGTEMNTYADLHTFFAVYPEQPASSNANKCWNWFEPAHQERGSGEPAIIAGIVDEVKREYTVDDSRVYVAGISAGGAMSVIMAATYPDVFAAAGVSAGLEYKAGHDLPSALIAQTQGGPDPVGQGNAAYTAMGEYARVVPVIVFHGTLDVTVVVTNGHQVLSQWAQTNDLASDDVDNDDIDDIPEATLPGSVPGGHTYTRYVYNDASGADVMEKYIVDDMRHAWSGGSSAGSYTDPQGPKASEIMWQFFVDHPNGGTELTPTPDASLTPIITATPPACTIEFSDVQPGSTFYPYVRCLACRNIVGGYDDGLFRPDSHVTRGQLAKIVAGAAGFSDPVSGQTFADVAPDSTFYLFVERLASRQVMSGYPCGGIGEPCDSENRPYFRPGEGATRGQTAKIVSQAFGLSDPVPEEQQTFADVPRDTTFWVYIERLLTSRPDTISGYPCGGDGEPCDGENRPYFRPNNGVTRGQASKIVANAFFPGCQPGR